MRMDETHLSVFHSVSNRARGKRDWTSFTLHDLTDFYVESVTAHRIKINDHSCFQNRWPKLKMKRKLKYI